MLNKLFSYLYNIFCRLITFFCAKTHQLSKLVQKIRAIALPTLLDRSHDSARIAASAAAYARPFAGESFLKAFGTITGFYGIHTTSASAPARIQMPLPGIFSARAREHVR
jgi:hypothetical protein